jgi:thiamine-phosphate pyrophosphorylase
LLAGLLEEQEGRPADLLSTAGLDTVAFRRIVSGGELPPPTNIAPSPQPLSPAVQGALAHAHRLARQTAGDRTAATEHLLVALLREDAALLAVTDQLGLSIDRLEANVMARQEPPLYLDEPLCLSPGMEETTTSRILDVGANRAREALRVIEDYCRFGLDDAFLTGQWKRLRHELSGALNTLPASSLLGSRDTLGDVGTDLSTAMERHRASLLAVVQANCKRLQEALRSLEEFGKLHSPDLGATLEQLRYRSYTLERATVFGAEARKRLVDARLYLLVTSALCRAALDWTIREAAAGGAQVIQLREKTSTDRELLERARDVRRWTREAGVLFIMNDRPDIARLVDADGVHVGQEDLPIQEARRIMGPDALIGVSTHALDQVENAVLEGASYIGVGPAFPSGTKEFAAFPGLEFARRAVAQTSLPAFVIGGIDVSNVQQVVNAGLRRIAVSRAVCESDDPRRTAAELRRVLDGA